MTITMHNEYPKRLIEVDLPIARISAHARAEKDSRLGHIPRLHIYPAARPVAACRAVICASFWPDPVDLTVWAERGEAIPVGDGSVVIRPQRFLETARERMTAWANRHLGKVSKESYSRFVAIQNGNQTLADPLDLQRVLLDFIADFANWDNSTDKDYLETARALTQAAHEALGGEPDTRPLVVDPFAGGGAIPLESLRLGADVFSSDLNPVAIIIQKVLLEYIPKYGKELANELTKWCDWLKKNKYDQLSKFYPKDEDGSIPVAYLWARTILSEAPGEDQIPLEVPLLRSMWLARKGNRKRALRWVRNQKGEVQTVNVQVKYCDGTTRIVRRPLLDIFEPKTFSDVERGTASRNSATCPVTGYTTSAKQVENQLKKRNGGAADARLYCVVIDRVSGSRDFRITTDQDYIPIKMAADRLEELKKDSLEDITLIPNEPLPLMSGVFNAPIYGHNDWGSLFTPRQMIALTCFSKSVSEYVERITNREIDYIKAVTAIIGLTIDRLADLNASLCVWQLNTANTAHVFGRWAIPMVVDFGEVNPIAGAGGSPESSIRRSVAFIDDMNGVFNKTAHVEQCSATEQSLPDDSVDLLFTDPPYYNAIPYADLLDFFYVWLRRSIRFQFREILKNDLNPKEKEICEMSGWDPDRYFYKDKEFFEREMETALRRSCELLNPKGLGVVVFAHKSTAGWEAMLQSLIDGKWVITASWPIDTEMGSRLRAKNSAALASSVHLVCRPRKNPDGSLQENIGDWRDVLAELPQRIHDWMPRLAEEGVVGADAIFACLGPALEVFSRYSRVEKSSGEAVTLKEYLEHVWAAVSKEALSMIFKDPDTAGLEPDARLTAMWLWTLGASSSNADVEDSAESEDEDADEESSKAVKVSGFTLEFDAARKIAQGLGVHLEKAPSVVEVKGDKAKLLSVAERVKYLFGKDAETTVTGKTPRKKKQPVQQSLFAELQAAESATQTEWGEVKGPKPGTTVLDRLHQAMVLFAAGRGEAMKHFLVEEGIGNDARFWKLAQSLTALYPGGSEEKRWVDGVLARKKGLGF